jgi:hypothetical protein
MKKLPDLGLGPDMPKIRTNAQVHAHNAVLRSEIENVLIRRSRPKRETQDAKAKGYAQTAAGRRHLRGFPVAGTGGLDIRRDPLHELLARERGKLKSEAARKAYDAIDAR